MDENKNLNNSETQVEATEVSAVEESTENTAQETAAETDVAQNAEADKKNKKEKKAKAAALKKSMKEARPKKLKNQSLFKHGGYSLIITACVLAALILLNVMVGLLSDRFNLEFDMSSQKVNTVSKENVKYIKDVDIPVTITVCADEDTYTSDAMAQYAQQLYMATADNATDYFKQTINLVNKYAAYNDKIEVRFIDSQDPKFTEISTKYPNDKIAYGDILVTASPTAQNGKKMERYKIITFKDIYVLSDEQGYAAQGYGYYTISGNNIETALTSAVAYATSNTTKKIALLTGHTGNDYSTSYVSLLKDNNFEVTTITDKLITNISNEYDAVAIIAPNNDFIGSELDAISKFLDNNGALSKGLIYFADATTPALPNLYEFLAQWGISVKEGLLFETNANNHMASDPTTMGIYPAEDKITEGMQLCITGYNVPITEAKPADTSITVTPIMTTLESVVAAPIGSAKDWDTSKADKGTYLGVVQAAKQDYNEDNDKITSYVMVFSGIEYIHSQYAESQEIANKNITLACTQRATGVTESKISFVSKTITNESFATHVKEPGVTAVFVIFMIAIPILVIAAGIFIFIRRKNA